MATPAGATRASVIPATRHDTVDHLARALGFESDDAVTVDGQRIERFRRLADSGIRSGSEVSAVDHSAANPRRPSPMGFDPAEGRGPRITVTVVAGPDCGVPVPLGVGRHLIGRHPAADLQLRDPRIELHHGHLDVTSNGQVSFTQLTGATPARIGGEVCRAGQPVPNEGVLKLGATWLLVEHESRDTETGTPIGTGGVVPSTTDPWRSVVHRGAVTSCRVDSDVLSVPAPIAEHQFPSATALIGAAVGVLGAVAIAVFMGQVMFALFALFGAVASLATWLVGVGATVRQRRRSRVAFADATAAFRVDLTAQHVRQRDHHVSEHLSIGRVLDVVLGNDSRRLWERRVGPLSATIGRARQRWTPRWSSDASVPHDFNLALETASWLHDVSSPLVLEPGRAVAVRGDVLMSRALVRSVVVQLAVSSGPADLRVVVLAKDPAIWQWAAWLPHTRSPRGTPMVLDASDAGELPDALSMLGEEFGDLRAVDPGESNPTPSDALSPSLVLVTDAPQLLAARTGPLRRFLERVQPTVIAQFADDEIVPSLFEQLLDVGTTGVAAWRDGQDASAMAVDITVAGLDERTAAAAARRLAALIDPEDEAAGTAHLPGALGLADVDDLARDRVRAAGAAHFGVVARRGAATAIDRRWTAGGPDPAPIATLGRSADGAVEIDLVRDGPHALIAGTTGSGKSELLRTLVVGMASHVSPQHLTFVLVDYKGGATFDACAHLPHVVGLVTDLDDGLAERALVSLDAELHRRESLLRSAGVSDLTEYRRQVGHQPIARLVVVIDEFAALANELPDFLAALVGVAQRGRSLGVHLVLATQRPAGVVNDDIRANTNLRLALRLNGRSDAIDVVGDDAPARFSRNTPGRAAIRLGPDDLVVFQSARCTGPAVASPDVLTVRWWGADKLEVTEHGNERTELSVAVAAISDAAAAANLDHPHRPWIEPLPALLHRHDVDDVLAAHGAEEDGGHDAVGLVDEPKMQRRTPLRWNQTTGNLALIGVIGSGTTATLIALLTAHCRSAPPNQVHCYVIDARGDDALDAFGSVAHCGGVIRPSETERLHRLLERLVAEIDARIDGSARVPAVRVVLAIDGLEPLRTSLAPFDRTATSELLDRVLGEGAAVGIAVCATVAPGASTTALAPSDTWLFHVGDDAAHRGLGGRSAPVGPDQPGRLEVVSTGCAAQVAEGADGLAELSDRTCSDGPAPIDVLPSSVDPAALQQRTAADRATRTEHAGVDLLVGIDSSSLASAVLSLPAGDHLFVGGASGSGKTSALNQLAAAWQAARPSGHVIEVDRPRPLTTDRIDHLVGRSAGDSLPDPEPVLIVVDDAERVDDPDGVFAAIVASRDPQFTVLAAARLEAIRSSYNHWARDVAKSRCGLILAAPGDVDGDLLGVTLPRRSLIAPRPGLAWLVDARGHRLVQIANPHHSRESPG